MTKSAEFLKTGLRSLAVLLLSAACVLPAAAKIPTGPYRPGYVRQAGPNLYVSAIPAQRVETYAAPETRGRQHKDEWCWAAASQMALNLAGVDTTQEQIVQRVFGSQADKPGDTQDYLKALSGVQRQYDGQQAQVTSWEDGRDDRQYINDLAHGWPLIIGLSNPDGSGHAYLMTGIVYHRGTAGQVVYESVILRDPWPTHQSKVMMSWNQYQARVHRVIRYRVQPI